MGVGVGVGTVAESSLMIVPTAVLVPSVNPTGFESCTVSVSSDSTRTSPTTRTSMVFDVSPGLNVTEPDAAK